MMTMWVEMTDFRFIHSRAASHSSTAAAAHETDLLELVLPPYTDCSL